MIEVFPSRDLGGAPDPRPALLAALAEPHRLAIIDALALGDLAPTELASLTDQPSNLLAHHLGVLERAGAVRRRRSDADARRTYLTLAWEQPLVAAAVAGAAPPSRTLGERAGSRIVFVCLANSARSQMAAAILASGGFTRVASAGTAPAAAIHPFALAELERRGLAPLSPAPASAAVVLRPDDLVVAVCDNAYETLGAPRVALHWSVPDPASGGAADFARAFDDLTPRVGRLAAALSQRKEPA